MDLNIPCVWQASGIRTATKRRLRLIPVYKCGGLPHHRVQQASPDGRVPVFGLNPRDYSVSLPGGAYRAMDVSMSRWLIRGGPRGRSSPVSWKRVGNGPWARMNLPFEEGCHR